MPRTIDQVLADFGALQPSDFDNEAAGISKLYGLTNELMALPEPERAIPALFAFMERMPSTELGTPGPLVHALEQMRGHYEHELVESIKRQPTGSAVAMAIGLFNGTDDVEQRKFYFDLIQFAMEHPSRSDSAFYEAQNFIEYQRGAAS